MANASLVADVKARTTDFERGMDRARGKNESFIKSMFSVEGAIGKAARGAALGLNVLREGLDLVGVSSDSLAGDALKVGASIATGFAVGGPVGAALAATNEAIKAMSSAFGAADAAASRLADTIRKTTARDESRIWSAEKITNLELAYERYGKALENVARLQREVQGGNSGARSRLGAALRLLDTLDDTIKRLEGEQRASEAVVASRERQVAAETKIKDAQEEQTRILMDQDAVARRSVRAIIEAGERQLQTIKDQDAARKKAEEDARRAQVEIQAELWTEAEIHDKKQQILEHVAGLQKDAAGAAVAGAEAHERATRAIQAQTSAIRQQVDITKRFATLPGSGGMFGFGAGQVGVVWSGDPVMRRRGRLGGQGAAAAQGGGMGVPDLSPAVNATTAAIKGLPAQYQRLANALGTMQSAAQETLQRVGDSTTRAIGKIAEQVAALRTRVKQIEDRQAAAAALGTG